MFLTITNIKSTPKIYFLTASEVLSIPPPFAEWGIDEWDKIKLRTIGN